MRLTEEQKRERMTMIGSSDIAAIVGVSPYRDRNAFAVFNEKLGYVSRDEDGDDIDNDAFWFGHEVEPIIAKWYEKKTGEKLVAGGTFRHPEYEWAGATHDYRILGKRRNVEIKFVGAQMMRGWDTSRDDGIPHDYLVQVTWQQWVAGFDVTDVAALIGGPNPHIFRIEFDQSLANDLKHAGETFWKRHIATGEPPPITAEDSVRAYLQAKYPKDIRPMLPATETIEAVARERMQHASVEKEAAAQKKIRDHALMMAAGDAAGFNGEGWKFTWKVNKAGQRACRFTVRGEE